MLQVSLRQAYTQRGKTRERLGDGGQVVNPPPPPITVGGECVGFGRAGINP